MALTYVQLRNLKPKEKVCEITDRGGLHVFVPPSGSILWRMAYRFEGKLKPLAFGQYPTVPLVAARRVRDVARKLLEEGIDPPPDRFNAPTITDERVGRLTLGKIHE